MLGRARCAEKERCGVELGEGDVTSSITCVGAGMNNGSMATRGSEKTDESVARPVAIGSRSVGCTWQWAPLRAHAGTALRASVRKELKVRWVDYVHCRDRGERGVGKMQRACPV
jgi:hypothetical protein